MTGPLVTPEPKRLPTERHRLLSIYLALEQYPILARKIRSRMRKDLFARGVITRPAFEARARRMAILSQRREGLVNPYAEETSEVWEQRLSKIRDHLTDLLFSQHFSFEEFERIVTQALSERGIVEKELLLSFNPELEPLELVIKQAMSIENMPPKERTLYEHRLEECKVVLIRNLISDQLRYINVAKEWLTVSDLVEVRRRKIGFGRIGGKAAGMLLAVRLLSEVSDPEIKACLNSAESYFVGADEFYAFISINNLFHWMDQKYKTEEEMRSDYPQILYDYEHGQFPPDIEERLTSLLVSVGPRPLIVRSSSLLEDNFGTSFAGKYDSVFLPNQGTLEENRKALIRGIGHVYGSTHEPNALLYRRSKGLLDYDERMAVLIQVVQGEKFGRYYLPHASGVAFSRNMYRWAPQITREDGFIRMVWGLGTRAVDRVGNDYPRLIALSHPTLRPSKDVDEISRYSQRYVDLINLEKNCVETLSVKEVISTRYGPLRYIAQIKEDGYFLPIQSTLLENPERLIITYDELLRRTPFADYMRRILQTLESHYGSPVDMEFTLELGNLQARQPSLCITILQCRPQSHLMETRQVALPVGLKDEEIIFSTHFMVPEGFVERVEYVVFVPPEAYFTLPTLASRQLLARTIGKLNKALSEKAFICVGPGRWGSSNSDLGVPIGYADIFNTKVLVELAGKGIGPEPEPSLGTHFFQDLMEAQIYPLAIMLDDQHAYFNREFFYNTPNHLAEWLEVDRETEKALRLIRVSDYREGSYLQIVMHDEQRQAIAFLQAE